MECSRNLDLETLVVRDSWASVEEMEIIIIIIKELQFSGFKSASMNRSVLFVCD